MRLNIEAINKLIESQYRGNTTWFADEIGVNRSYLTMILMVSKKMTALK